jgi:hypothetical protein
LLQLLAVCEALQMDTNFESLDLTNNFLNDLAAQAVASLIKASMLYCLVSGVQGVPSGCAY